MYIPEKQFKKGKSIQKKYGLITRPYQFETLIQAETYVNKLYIFKVSNCYIAVRENEKEILEKFNLELIVN